MTFRALLHAVPEAFSINHAGPDANVYVPLTISEDRRFETAVEVRLWAGYWNGVPMHEFKYAIRLHDRDSGSVRDVFDRYEAAPFLQPVRAIVLPSIVAAAEAIVQRVSPDVIYRATYLTRPPPASLFKHAIVTDMIVRLGYELLHEGFDPRGRRYWIMLKSEAE